MIAVLVLLVELGMLCLYNKGSSDGSVSDIIAIILILIFSFFLLGYFNSNRRIKPYKKAITLGYLFRLFLLLFDNFGRKIYVLPNASADADAFYRLSVLYARGMPTRKGAYIEVMGTLFRFIGTNRLFGQFLSMLVSIVGFVFLAHTFSELNLDTKIKKKIYLATCLLPNCAILHSVFLREAVIYMFLCLSLYSFVKWIRTKEEKYYYLAAAFVFPAAAFHSGTIAVLVGYVAIRFFYDNKSEEFNISVRNVLAVSILVALTVLILNSTGNRFLGKFNQLDSIEDIANTHSLGSSSYAQYVGNSNNPVNLIVFTIPRIFYFLFSPLPWQWRGISDLIAFFFSSLFYFVSIFSAIKYLRKGKKPSRALVIVLLIVIISAVFVFAWGTSNTGTATRHRDKLVAFIAVVLALSIQSKKTPYRETPEEGPFR